MGPRRKNPRARRPRAGAPFPPALEPFTAHRGSRAPHGPPDAARLHGEKAGGRKGRTQTAYTWNKENSVRPRRRVLFLVATLVISVTIGRPPSLGSATPPFSTNFSTNQELPLPPLAPIGPVPLAFIVRGLEPSTRVDQDGTAYVSSIRGVPGGVDLHRYYATMDGPSGGGGTYPFKYEGQPDNCGIFNASQGGCANNQLDQFGLGLGGADAQIAVNFPATGTPNPAHASP